MVETSDFFLLNIKAVGSSETSQTMYESTRRSISDALNLQELVCMLNPFLTPMQSKFKLKKKKRCLVLNLRS